MAVNKLTKRWLYNSFGVILVIVISLVVGFAFGVRSLYYNNVRQSVLTQANVVNTLLVRYSEDSSTSFSVQLRSLVERFEKKDKMELMTIDATGKVSITSSGFAPEQQDDMPDYQAALLSAEGYGEYIGSLYGENVLAITMVAPVGETELSATRYVVSLSRVDRQIIMFVLIVVLIGVSIMFFVIFSSSYFINSIIYPLGEVGETARRIAQGDLGVRLEKVNDDEIGELCETINNMAQELAATEQMKNDFISSVSHELRTPLTAIRGWGETLETAEGLEAETLRKGMHVILTETDRLQGMVEELLDFSRMQSGRLQLNMERLDIVAELSDVVLMFTERARKEGVTLDFAEPEDIIMVQGDRNRLRQVFINILDNALKYSDTGGSIIVTGQREQQFFTARIADTGQGISPEDLPKIKTKFYKGKSSRRGSGIGLAVADEIVAMHGGRLEIASQLGQGTTVAIALPVCTGNEAKQQANH